MLLLMIVICRAIAGTLTMVTYGRQVVTDDDEYVNLVGKATSMTVASGTPGSTLPDFVPFCQSGNVTKVVNADFDIVFFPSIQ